MRALVANNTESRSWRGAPAFTLIDVLVSMAVIAILISIILPSLHGASQTAKQVVCRSNVRQIGIGIAMYADENNDRIPPSTNVGLAAGGSDQAWKTMMLRTAAPSGQFAGRWDGLGLLVENYLPAPKLFYCPSHTGEFRFGDIADTWDAEGTEIMGNYQYRARGPMAASTATATPTLTRRLSLIAPGAALVADGMRTRADFNHKIGSNVLRANLSVSWYSDRAGRLSSIIPTDESQVSTTRIEQAWNNLDSPN